MQLYWKLTQCFTTPIVVFCNLFRTVQPYFSEVINFLENNHLQKKTHYFNFIIITRHIRATKMLRATKT